MITDEVYQPIAQASADLTVLGHGYTYSAHPVCAAVALETLKIYEERDILSHVKAVSPRFQKRLHALIDHPLVGETRGVGLIGAVEIVADKEIGRADVGTPVTNAHLVCRLLLEKNKTYT